MKQYQEIKCPKCQNTDLVKNGHSENGTQRYRCKGCKKSFQQDYSYRAWEPGIKEKIDHHTLNPDTSGWYSGYCTVIKN